MIKGQSKLAQFCAHTYGVSINIGTDAHRIKDSKRERESEKKERKAKSRMKESYHDLRSEE